MKFSLLFIISLLVVLGHLPQVLASDQAEATRRYQELRGKLPSLQPQQVGGYQTDRPPQAGLFDQAKGLDQAASQAASIDPAAQLLMETAHQRPYFVIDPTQDPMVIHGHAAVTQPEQVLAATTESVIEPPQYEIKSCEESKPAFEVSCTETLKVATLTQRSRVYQNTYYHGWSGNYYSHYGSNRESDDHSVQRWWDGCNWWHHEHKNIYKYFIQNLKFDAESKELTISPWQEVSEQAYAESEKLAANLDKLSDDWLSSCTHLQSQVKAGICQQTVKKCLTGPETRSFSYFDQASSRWVALRVHRDCWQWQTTYRCQGYPSANNCTRLRQQGCEQMNSQVLRSVGGQAVVWQQTFRCAKGRPKVTYKPVVGQTAFKLPDQVLPNYAPNRDMSQAIANLEVLKEVGADLKANRAEQDGRQVVIGIFRGQPLGCDKHVAGASDCCTSLAGWGVSLKLTKCNAGEKQLAQLKERGLCHEVGKYCAEKEKITGICLRWRTNYCCFPSKLSRIVHEQGRPQLGMSWGSGEQPQCRGFLVDELARLDFSRLNLSELYADINARMQAKLNGQQTKQILERNITERIKHMTSKGQADGRR